VPIFENTGSNRLESGHGVLYRDGGRGYEPLYGAALCGGVADGGTGGAARVAARVAARRACADEYLKRWKVKFAKSEFLIGNI
jgi:hypothetical protein